MSSKKNERLEFSFSAPGSSIEVEDKDTQWNEQWKLCGKLRAACVVVNILLIIKRKYQFPISTKRKST
jgi:hypothetical protein